MTARPTYEMPDDVAEALRDAGVADDYAARPHYQRNDYIGWIERAKQPATRGKRIRQMLDELRGGGVYMGMAHAPSRKDAGGAAARAGGAADEADAFTTPGAISEAAEPAASASFIEA